MIVVYLSNRYIRIVEGKEKGGKITVSRMLHAEDDTGCIMNGTVTGEDAFKNLIKKIWDEYQLPKKNVSLVIDSSQFNTRTIEVPDMRPEQMTEYLEREFAGVERINDPVYGYFFRKTEKSSKMKQLFAMMVPKAFVADYIQRFADMGIKVRCVESSTGAMIRLLEQISVLQNKTSIVQFIDGVTLTNVLMVDGKYRYSSKSRLFSEPGSEGFAAETGRAVSNLLQFAKAQNIPSNITTVYVAGMSGEDLMRYRNSLQIINGDLTAAELSEKETVVIHNEKADEGFSRFALAIGGLIETDFQTGIVGQMVNKKQRQKERAKAFMKLMPIVVSFGIMAVICLYELFAYLPISLQLQNVRDYNNQPQVISACEEFDQLTSQIQMLQGRTDEIMLLKNSVESYPNADSAVKIIIQNCADTLVTAQITKYQAASGELSMDVSSDDPDNIHQFIARLYEEDFLDVKYTGYSQDSAGTWRTQVTCTLKGVQTEEDEEATDESQQTNQGVETTADSQTPESQETSETTQEENA